MESSSRSPGSEDIGAGGASLDAKRTGGESNVKVRGRDASLSCCTSVTDRAGESEHCKSVGEFENEGEGGMCEDTSSGGDVEGRRDKGTCSDVDSGSGTTSVHEDACKDVKGKVEVIEGVISGAGWDPGTTSVGLENAGDDEESRGGVGVIEMDSGSDLGTLFVHEDAGEVVGGREGVVGVIEGTNVGSGSDSGWTFVAEGPSV